MKNRMAVMVVVALSACALALFAVAGCSSGSSSGSASAASSSASASSSEAASASSASAESASSESASASAEAASSEAASSAASSAASESASAASASSESAEASSAAAASSGASAAAGEQVFEGTVRVLDVEGLLDLQKQYRDMSGLDASMFNGDGTFAVLVLDEPTEVTGMYGDGTGPGTEEANLLGIGEYSDYGYDVVVDYGDLDQWRQLDGQNVVITAVVDDIWFPSDVSLPIGEPRVNNCTLLGD